MNVIADVVGQFISLVTGSPIIHDETACKKLRIFARGHLSLVALHVPDFPKDFHMESLKDTAQENICKHILEMRLFHQDMLEISLKPSFIMFQAWSSVATAIQNDSSAPVSVIGNIANTNPLSTASLRVIQRAILLQNLMNPSQLPMILTNDLEKLNVLFTTIGLSKAFLLKHTAPEDEDVVLLELFDPKATKYFQSKNGLITTDMMESSENSQIVFTPEDERTTVAPKIIYMATNSSLSHSKTVHQLLSSRLTEYCQMPFSSKERDSLLLEIHQKLGKQQDSLFHTVCRLVTDSRVAIDSLDVNLEKRAAFIHYTYARLSSMERHLGKHLVEQFLQDKAISVDTFDVPCDTSLAVQILQFPVVLNNSRKTRSVSLISNYVFRLCRDLSDAWHILRVKDQPEKFAKPRFLLFYSGKCILEYYFRLLHVEPIINM